MEQVRWQQLAELARAFGLDPDVRQKRSAQLAAFEGRAGQLRAENVPGDTQIVEELIADWKNMRQQFSADLLAAYNSVRLRYFLMGAATVGAVVVVSYLIGRRVRRRRH